MATAGYSDLRLVVGVLSVARAESLASRQPHTMTRLPNEEPTTMGNGTPGLRLSTQELQKRPSLPPAFFRETALIRIPPDCTITQAMGQFRKAFLRDVPGAAARACSALAWKVESLQVLRGYSSAVAAAACTGIVAESLQTSALLEDWVLRALDIERDAVRIARNVLWLERKKLSTAVKAYGGSVAFLKTPRLRNGKLDTRTYNKGMEVLWDLPSSQEQSRKSSRSIMGSSLSLVEHSTACTASREAIPDCGLPDDSLEGDDSDESWEDWDGLF